MKPTTQTLDSDSSGELDDSNALCVPLVPLHRAISFVNNASISTKSTVKSLLSDTHGNQSSVIKVSSSKEEQVNQNAILQDSLAMTTATKPAAKSGSSAGYFPSVHKGGAESTAPRKKLLRRVPA